MKDEFCTYELAVKLKELGFDYECFAFYNNYRELHLNHTYDLSNIHLKAPLWQQVFDWFRLEKNLYVDIFRVGLKYSANIEDMSIGSTLCGVCENVSYNEARLASLIKLIELVGTYKY